MRGPKGDYKIFSNSKKQIHQDAKEVDLHRRMRSDEFRRFEGENNTLAWTEN
jgi:hypothetical protein